MSSILDLLSQHLGGDAVRQISQDIGADEQSTQNALAAALPMILGAVTRQGASEQGAEALLGAIDRDQHDGGVLKDAESLKKAAVQHGDGIMGHLFSGRQETVASGLSKTSGLNPQSASQLLKLLGPMVLGAVGQQKREQGLSAGDLFKFLGQERQQLEERAPQQMSMVGQLLDTDGDGDFDMSDMLSHGSRLLGGFFKK